MFYGIPDTEQINITYDSTYNIEKTLERFGKNWKKDDFKDY